ncbi:hypothetical protein OPT61_g9531 [Boeremia exigua]|uniref:Uncharacterized protein n=1 Tax=Boeremia exigua TaxID=749465 RepID=A0ACC2HTW4_9PLEO|nr:hypothetical protein OPT61_g9531 [Boeremia exigua]
MPEQLKASEVTSKTDPSVAKQYDTTTDKTTQIQDFFSLADNKKICILNTHRNGIGADGGWSGSIDLEPVVNPR